MTDEINFKNNPLHGVGLKTLLVELVDHYGFEILFAYLNINCFKTKPSIDSSIKFLKKTDWAREKVEAFYLYQYKSLPRASDEQFELPPRDRIVPEGQTPGEPAELSLEDAARLREKRERKSAERSRNSNNNRPERGRAYSGQRGTRDSLFIRNNKSAKNNSEQTNNSRDSADNKSHATENHSTENKVDPWAKWRK